MTVRLSILGAKGKMGQRLLELAALNPEVCVASSWSCEQGDLTQALLKCDVAIDFTSHLMTEELLGIALNTKTPLVIGTTGHSLKEKMAIEAAARTLPILYSPNFSFAMALCLDATERFSKALGSSCAIHITETHHVHKKDSPSGTAIALAHAASFEPREIPICSVREGEVIGEHTVIFECGLERIELKHTAHSRDAFALGALRGAQYLAGKPPGLYSLRDLCGS